MSASQVTHPQYKHYAKIALLNALFIILQFAKKKTRVKSLINVCAHSVQSMFCTYRSKRIAQID